MTVGREDMWAPDSLELLKNAGLDFQRHDEIGIEPNDFAELMITSGLVLTEDTKWISFHRLVRLAHIAPALIVSQWLRLRLLRQASHWRLITYK